MSNHPFVDGNKRIGVLVLLVFLQINGIDIKATNDDVTKLGLGIAEGSMNYDGVLQWIQTKI